MKMRSLFLFLFISLLGSACAWDVKSGVLGNANTPTRPAKIIEPSAVGKTTEPETQSPSAVDTLPSPALPVLEPAPAWNNDVWINSDRPLRLEALRGKVVLLEFWTFG